jgi:hypothetical protein
VVRLPSTAADPGTPAFSVEDTTIGLLSALLIVQPEELELLLLEEELLELLEEDELLLELLLLDDELLLELLLDDELLVAILHQFIFHPPAPAVNLMV